VAAPSGLRFGGRQVRRRGVHVDRPGEAVLQKVVMNRADAAAHIQQDGLRREREFPDRRQDLAGGRIGPAAPEAPQVAPRGALVELLVGGLTMTVGQ